jgi:hypothetical protein
MLGGYRYLSPSLSVRTRIFASAVRVIVMCLSVCVFSLCGAFRARAISVSAFDCTILRVCLCFCVCVCSSEPSAVHSCDFAIPSTSGELVSFLVRSEHLLGVCEILFRLVCVIKVFVA